VNLHDEIESKIDSGSISLYLKNCYCPICCKGWRSRHTKTCNLPTWFLWVLCVVSLRKKHKLWRFEKRVMRGKKNCNQDIGGMWPIRILLNEHLMTFMGYVILLGWWSLGGCGGYVRLDMFLGWLNRRICTDFQWRNLLRNTKVEDRKGEG